MKPGSARSPIVSALVALAILVAVNYLGVRHNKRWDLTAAKQFTLSDQTRKILEGLQKPVAIKVFAQSNEFQRFRERLDEYQYASKQVSTEYIDAIKQPSRAQQYQVQTLGTVVFEYDGRTERVTSDGEQELTNGLIKVVQGTQLKVYFVQGHGEKNTEGSGNDSYSGVSSSLGSENYTVAKLVLAQQKDVPADASVLIVAGPKTDLFAPEIDMIKRYLAKGGKVLFMLDPPDKPESGAIPNIAGLLKEWGIEVGDNVVVDVSGMGRLVGTGPETPVAANYQPHAITDHFELLTAYRLARSVAPITGGTSGKFPQTLVDTSPNSWGETDIKTLSTTGEVKREIEKGDKAGPVSLAAAVSSPATDAPGPGRRRQAGGHRQARDPHGGLRGFRLRLQWLAGIPGQPRPLPQHRQLALEAGEPHLDPAARRAGSRRHDDSEPAEHRAAPDTVRDSPADHGRRHRRLGTEAVDARAAVAHRSPGHRPPSRLVRVSRLDKAGRQRRAQDGTRSSASKRTRSRRSR